MFKLKFYQSIKKQELQSQIFSRRKDEKFIYIFVFNVECDKKQYCSQMTSC